MRIFGLVPKTWRRPEVVQMLNCGPLVYDVQKVKFEGGFLRHLLLVEVSFDLNFDGVKGDSLESQEKVAQEGPTAKLMCYAE